MTHPWEVRERLIDVLMRLVYYVAGPCLNPVPEAVKHVLNQVVEGTLPSMAEMQAAEEAMDAFCRENEEERALQPDAPEILSDPYPMDPVPRYPLEEMYYPEEAEGGCVYYERAYP